jgi:hypothetical protein
VLLVCAALALAVHAVQDTDSVKEIVERLPTMANGGDDTHPNAYGPGGGEDRDVAPAEGDQSAEETPEAVAQGTGYFKDTPNAPGPRHGLPGYKESHQWEQDTDMFSPLVFDWRFHSAKNMKGTENEMTSKADWLNNVIEHKDANGNLDPLKAPNCKQGSATFGANDYAEANKEMTDIKLIAGNCKELIKHYLTQGIFRAYPLVRNPAKYDDVQVQLLSPKMGRNSDKSPWFQAGKATHFDGLALGQPVAPNKFVAARHMTLQYWMKVRASQELPLGEYMGYGGKRTDSFFRSGFGCLDAGFKKCFFIFAFGASAGEEYFHSYNDENFETKQLAFFGGKWGHMTMILSTASPASCPSNKPGPSEDACKGLFEVYVNGKEIKLVDWNHGESTENAKKFTRGPVVPIWNILETTDGSYTVLRRFFMSPPKDCETEGNCGGVTNNNYKIGFPWPNAWTDNLFICDFGTLPSQTGGFGDAAKRKLAAEAIYGAAKERVKQSCGEDGE